MAPNARTSICIRGYFVGSAGQPDVKILHHTGSELISSALKQLNGARIVARRNFGAIAMTKLPPLLVCRGRRSDRRARARACPRRSRCSVPRAGTPGSCHRRYRAPGTGATPHLIVNKGEAPALVRQRQHRRRLPMTDRTTSVPSSSDRHSFSSR